MKYIIVLLVVLFASCNNLNSAKVEVLSNEGKVIKVYQTKGFINYGSFGINFTDKETSKDVIIKNNFIVTEL